MNQWKLKSLEIEKKKRREVAAQEEESTGTSTQ